MSEKIKYELGTVGGTYSKILFSQYPGVGSGTITLSDTVDNYKHIIVCAQYPTYNQNYGIRTMMVDTDMLRNSDTGTLRIFILVPGISSGAISVHFTLSGNILTITSTSSSYLITEVIGIG